MYEIIGYEFEPGSRPSYTLAPTDPAKAEAQPMGIETMGKVTTEATLENAGDVWAIRQGLISPDQLRRIEVSNALVDTGATLISMPLRLIEQLGLDLVSTKRVRGTTGVGEAGLYSSVRLTIQGRSCTMDVLEVPDDVPVLIGQIPLEHLDFVVDLRDQKLIGNPAHGGEHMYELY
jgi:predicted aspartyl protease